MSYLTAADITDRALTGITMTLYLDNADKALEDLAEQNDIFDTSQVAFDAGDIAGTVLVKGASQTGESLILDGFTAVTGTVKAGTRIRIAGLSRTYSVQADAAIAGSEATLSIYPSLEASPANDVAVTFQKLHHTVKKWMVAYACAEACFDLSGTNSPTDGQDNDKYYWKYKEWSKKENELKKIISPEMISNEVDDDLERVATIGRTVRS